MKSRIILTSIFAIMIFAGMSYGQHVKIFDGRGYASVLPVAESGTAPDVLAFAGQTVRLRIAAVNNRSRDVNDMYIFQSPAYVVHAQVPCDARRPATTTSTGLSAGKVSWSYNKPAKEYDYALETEKSWKGTCRMLSIELKNGAEYRARILFR